MFERCNPILVISRNANMLRMFRQGNTHVLGSRPYLNVEGNALGNV